MKGLAIASLILGILGFTGSFIFSASIIFALLAVSLAIPPIIKGVQRAFAITELILGGFGVIISIILIWIGFGIQIIVKTTKTG
ncbi:unnamed protein product [marine sediment metagenome]|uniref:Uncharacterized protein n=1 Tax=marine sediment metagenome TaxID=412755 RepID=X1DVE5_9ZZZZ